jgi:uncharacterized protein
VAALVAACATAPEPVPRGVACPAGSSPRSSAALAGRETWCEDGSGVRRGRFELRYPDGKLAARGSYDAGRREGAYEAWHPNGARRASGHYAAGLRTGRWREWHANGALWTEASYTAGVLHGRWVERDYTGAVLFEGTYARGLLHGAWRSTFADGVERASGTSSRGKLDGLVKMRDRDGASHYELGYRANRAHGTWTYYSGARVTMIEHYRDGVLHGQVVEYAADGSVKSTVEYRDGQKIEGGSP